MGGERESGGHELPQADFNMNLPELHILSEYVSLLFRKLNENSIFLF